MASFNYIKTFIEDSGLTLTLALDSDGVLFEENVQDDPGTLVAYAENILPGSYAKSCTQQNEEWMVFSNLLAGTDIPRHVTNLDRISQVGPGAPPTIVGASSGTNVYTIAASPNGLTQPPAGPPALYTGHFQAVNWSSGPFSTSPGNVLTIFYRNLADFPTPSPDLFVGGAVYIDMTSAPFTGLTGTYIVTSLGQGFPPHNSGSPRWYFTVQVNQVGNTFVGGPGTATGSFQPSLTTMTLTTPAAINVGDMVTVAGAGAAGYDGTWTILASLNGGQYLITSTSLTSNIATYNYTIIGASPAITANEQITVTGCTNGPIVNGTSIFNVSNTNVDTAGVGTFTVVLNGANVISAPETGNAIVSGTIFQFDPGLSNLGPGINNIFGNSGGGTATIGGALTAGIRQAVTIFVTRNGLQTAPSPPVIFETSGSANKLQVSNIALGPPNVLARIVAFTGANGGNFFWIPTPVTVQGAGQPTTYTSTVISDNVTTQASFTFTDAVLLAATAIDIEGNDLFNQIEIGSPAWNIPYAGRMFYGLVNNQVQNFLNLTFDGGYLPNENGVATPLGWVVDPTDSGNGGQVTVSSRFGNSYTIANSTGSTQSIYGHISQSAYQDFYKVPIILPNFTYSIRATVRSQTGAASGFLTMELFSANLGVTFGRLSLPLNSLTTSFQIFTGPILDSPFLTQVPVDMVFEVYAFNIPDGVSVEVDRIEIFPDNQPVLNTNLVASYIGNLEAFDGVTGNLGVGEENNQPAIGAFVNYDILYILKSNSMFSSQDSPNNEPSNWTVREVSNKIGTCGINAYDYGEEWAVTACRAGLYMFNGGEPIKISQEIQPTWDALNWKYGSTICVRNDTVNRRIVIMAPMATPNQWLPDAPVNANPTIPNICLTMNYKELNSSHELAERGPIKISYSGKLISWDLSRKWSIWQIPANYADFVVRPDGSAPLMFCQANDIISQQIAGLLTDNGVPINSRYTTYGFVKPEQEQQFGPLLGDQRKLAKYCVLNVSGQGKMQVRLLPNSLTPTYPYVVPGGVTLTNPSQNNREMPLNVLGNYMFADFSTDDIDSAFQLSEVKLTMKKDPHSPIRGIP